MDMTEDRFESYLKSELEREVEENLGRLEGLEERVLEELRERAFEGGLFRRLRELTPTVRPKPALAFASTAVVFLIVGIFLGILISSGPIIRGEGIWLILAYPEAKSVDVKGDFSHWDPIPLKEVKDGIWVVKLDLPPGRYAYAFIVDEEKLVLDPRAEERVPGFNDIYLSVLSV